MASSDHIDMRKVEAQALIKLIERRDPVCMRLFIGMMERSIQAHPQLGAKDLLAKMIGLLSPATLNKKEKEFLCPNLSDSETTEEQLSITEAFPSMLPP
jgi:hypothetical protein